MARFGLFLPLIVLLGFHNATAQAVTPTPEAVTVITHCITNGSEPPADWTFAGTLLTFRRGDGIHGFRADTPSRYYIAFDNYTEYGRFGSLSPDGQWFASFVGRRERENSMMFNSSYYITGIHVVSTSPSREAFVIPFQGYLYVQAPTFVPVVWLNDTEFAAYSQNDHFGASEGWFLVNPFTGSVTEASADDEARYSNLYTSMESVVPDYLRYPVNPNNVETAYLARYSNPDSNTLHIVDPDSGQVYDTCIETDSIAVAPHADQVAVSIGGQDGFIYIVDIDDWAAYRLDLAANQLLAWVANP